MLWLDGPAVVRVNIFVRSISKIDDVTMVSAPQNQSIRSEQTHLRRKEKKKKTTQPITQT